MKNNKYQAGVIGLSMGHGHCIGYRNHPNCELAAICDVDEARLNANKNEFGVAQASTDYRDIINNPDIDVVSIASPDFFHAEHCIAAIRAGKHVLCEKPLTLTLQDAKNIIAEVEKSKVKFMIGQVCRYAPGFALAKRLVDQGAIGELYFVESEYAHNYNSAKGVNADWPVNDCTIAIYKFANNVIGKVLVSIGCVRPYTMRSCFYGTEGTIICDNTSPDIKICSRKFMAGKLDFASMPVNIANHNVSAEIADFMKCIINDTPVETSIYEGARTVAAALAAAESAKLGGQPVKIEQL